MCNLKIRRYNEAIGSWSIDLKDHKFWLHPRKNTTEDVYKRIKILVKLLEIFEAEHLFLLDTVDIHFSKEKMKTLTFSRSDQIGDFLLSQSICNEHLMYLRLHGKTNINFSEELEKELIVIHLDLTIYELEISVHGDFILPFKGINNEYQIDLATLNSNRLESCLKNVKKANLGNFIFPDEGVLWGEKYPIYGFRVYLDVPLTYDEDFPKHLEKDVKIFCLTNEQLINGKKKYNEFIHTRRYIYSKIKKTPKN